MAVNPAAVPERTVDDDLHELVRIVRPVMSLKGHAEIPAPLADAFERASLGPRHVPALLTVTVEGPLSVSSLADELGLSLSTTSLMVGELSRAGFVERAEDESDRRRTIVRLNERFRTDVDAWLDERLQPFRRTLERLSPRTRANFLEGWRVLAQELAESARRNASC